MWKGSVLVAALAVALLAVAGVAVATVGANDGTALTSDDVATTLAAVADDAVDDDRTGFRGHVKQRLFTKGNPAAEGGFEAAPFFVSWADRNDSRVGGSPGGVEQHV